MQNAYWLGIVSMDIELANKNSPIKERASGLSFPNSRLEPSDDKYY